MTSYEVVVNFIRATTTSKGLEVFARLDRKRYRRGRKFTDEDMKTVKLHPHRKHPDWNYTIIP